MAYSEDHIALAAEYALGTLDADERAQVEAMMAGDTKYTALVHAWEYRLGVLNQMVGSIEPRPIVWENIKAAIGHSTEQQAPLVLPEAPPPPAEPVVAEATPAVEPTPAAAPADRPAPPASRSGPQPALRRSTRRCASAGPGPSTG